ncbi:putative linker histone H1/H5, domain H15, winged helix-like DNA-binding domain superfamily [Helianthus debilis subsp. tardiflorus]
MDPTTVPPPYTPQQSPPPQNPHTPAGPVIEADRFPKGEPSGSRNMKNFKALVFKLAGRFSPANQRLIDRRFDDIVPDELLVPDHPPYDDMILTTLWELKAEGGSSEEDISRFIEKEYHELPWAHATILNHHLRDLCVKGKITMTHDKYYLRCLPINKPESSPSPSPCSSPLSSSCSSSSASIYTSPSSSSSSSSMSWGGSKKRRKKKNIKRRKCKIVQVSRRDSGRLRSRGRGRGRGGRGRGRELGQPRNAKGRNVEEPEQGTEDQNEVTSMEVEDNSNKDGDLPDVIAKVSEEENLPCVQNNKEQSRPQKKYNVTWIGRRARKLREDEIDFLNELFDDKVTELEADVGDAKVDEHVEQPERKEAEIDALNVKSDDDVTVLEADVGDAKVDEHVEQPEPKEEKGATDMEVEHNLQEENQQSDIVEGRTLGEERIMDDENLSEEQDSVMMQCEAHVTAASAEEQHGDTFDEQIQPEENEEECVEKTEESDEQVDRLTKEQVETKAQSADLHEDDDDDDDDDDVTEEPIHPQEQWVEKAEESDKQPDRVTEEQEEAKAQSAYLHNDDDVTEEPIHPQEQCVEKTVESDTQLDRLTEGQVEAKAQSADMHDDDVTEEPIHPKEQCVEKTVESDTQLDRLTEGQVEAKAQSADMHDDDDVTEEPIHPQEQCVEKTVESDTQLDRLTEGQVEAKAQSADMHDDDDVTEEPIHPQEQYVEKAEESDNQIDHLTKETKAQSTDLHDDDDVIEEAVHPQEQCVEKTEESLQSCEQDQPKNVAAKSAEQEEQQTEVNQKEIESADVQQEPFVEMIEQKNESCIHQTETSEKDSSEENNNPVRKEENTTSSGSTSEGSRRTLRQGLRSSSKKEDAAPKSGSKKQPELVTPVRRSLRSSKTISEAAVVTEVADHSKEQVTHLGRTRSSKRKTEIAEAEQVSNTRKTRRTGL